MLNLNSCFLLHFSRVFDIDNLRVVILLLINRWVR